MWNPAARAAFVQELERAGARDVSRNSVEQAIAIELRVLSRLAMDPRDEPPVMAPAWEPHDVAASGERGTSGT